MEDKIENKLEEIKRKTAELEMKAVAIKSEETKDAIDVLSVQDGELYESQEKMKKGEDPTPGSAFYNADMKKFRWLGKEGAALPEKPSILILDTFDNPFPERIYTIEFEMEEFTSMCPKTMQPDFATIHISYIPGEKCIETKSLKLYLQSYRNQRAFMERITNTIMNDITAACGVRAITILAEFNKRGGIGTKIQVGFRKTDEEMRKDIDAARHRRILREKEEAEDKEGLE